MADDLRTEVTTILDKVRDGQVTARARLVALIDEQLRQIAGQRMRRERPDHTLTPTALVNEAFLELLNEEALARPLNRDYFFAAAAAAMRQVLVDHARHRRASKRGGAYQRVPLDEVLDVFEKPGLDVLSLHDALDHLASVHKRQSEIVTLRYFGGLTVAQVAEQLEVSVALVESDWRKASAFLRKHLAPGE